MRSKIKSWLEAFSRKRNTKVNNLLKYQVEKCDELVRKTESLYHLSESRIQFDSIKYNKRTQKLFLVCNNTNNFSCASNRHPKMEDMVKLGCQFFI